MRFEHIRGFIVVNDSLCRPLSWACIHVNRSFLVSLCVGSIIVVVEISIGNGLFMDLLIFD